MSVYFGLGCLGLFGFGLLGFCYFAPRCVERPWVSGRGRCPFLGGWLGSFSVVAFGCSCEMLISFPAFWGARCLPISIYIGYDCKVGWVERNLFGLFWLSVGDSVCIVLLRREARRRPFRFISVWVGWVQLSSAFFFVPRPVE